VHTAPSEADEYFAPQKDARSQIYDAQDQKASPSVVDANPATKA
jgi:hypothetical protein